MYHKIPATDPTEQCLALPPHSSTKKRTKKKSKTKKKSPLGKSKSGADQPRVYRRPLYPTSLGCSGDQSSRQTRSELPDNGCSSLVGSLLICHLFFSIFFFFCVFFYFLFFTPPSLYYTAFLFSFLPFFRTSLFLM